MVYSFNWYIENKGILKVTGSQMHCKSGIFENSTLLRQLLQTTDTWFVCSSYSSCLLCLVLHDVGNLCYYLCAFCSS